MKEIAKVCQRLFQTSLASLDEGAMPIALGGDHSLAAGSVAAAAVHVRKQGKPLGLIWVDAHGDMNSPGVHGFGQRARHAARGAARHRARRARRTSPATPRPCWRRHTVLVGIRNLDEREKEIVRASKVHVFTMKEIDRLGIAEVMERAIAIASGGTGGFHVSYDLDACDPTVAPGVGTPVKGGLSYREAHVVMEMIAESRQMTSLDLVEVNPALDVTQHDRGVRHRTRAVSARKEHSVNEQGGTEVPPSWRELAGLRRGDAAEAALVALRLLEHVFEGVHQHHQRVGLLDQARVGAKRFQVGGFRAQAREDDHGHAGRGRNHDFAAGATAQGAGR